MALIRSPPSGAGPSLRRKALMRLSMPRSSMENSRSSTVRKSSSRETTRPADASSARNRSNSAEVRSTASLPRRTSRLPGVEQQIVHGQKFARRRRAGGPHAAQHRPHAGDEFARVERLGQVVVRADFQAEHAVGGRAPGRQHDDGHLRLPAHPAQHLQPADAGQHHVEHHDGVAARQDALDAGLAVVDGFQRKPFRLEIFGEQFRQAGVVVYREDALHTSGTYPITVRAFVENCRTASAKSDRIRGGFSRRPRVCCRADAESFPGAWEDVFRRMIPSRNDSFGYQWITL